MHRVGLLRPPCGRSFLWSRDIGTAVLLLIGTSVALLALSFFFFFVSFVFFVFFVFAAAAVGPVFVPFTSFNALPCSIFFHALVCRHQNRGLVGGFIRETSSTSLHLEF
jgi:hypothetical protein